MFESVTVIGAGRAGSAIAARLRERGVRRAARTASSVSCACRTRAIAEVAAAIPPGPWVAHVSGATPLAALAPHTRRFSVHPLQTLVRSRGPEQLDGAWAAVTAETPRRTDARCGSPRRSACTPFDLADDARALYHAGAVDGIELPRHAPPRRRPARGRCRRAARGLLPLMRRTIDERLRADRPDRTRRPRDRRATRCGDPRARAPTRTALRRAGGGDGPVKVVRHDRRGAG